MFPHAHDKLFRLAAPLLTVAVLAVTGCTSGITSSTATQSSAATGPAFIVGTDAPLASVVSYNATITGLVANPTNGGKPVSLLASGSTPTVDFARFNGLQTLLDMNDVAAGTYDSVTITLGTSTIGYLNVPTCSPTPCTPAAPSILSMAASYATGSNPVTVKLDKPLVIGGTASVPVGVRIDFDLAKSIEVDGTGAFTGTVIPTFNVNTVATSDGGGYIDELSGGVTTPPTGTTEPNSFVIQGPHGEKFTINTTSSTQWDGDATLASLNTNSIVQVMGKLDPADQTLDADEVAILSDSNFYATGQITYVTEASGQPASNFDLYVRALEPSSLPISLGNIAQVNLTGSEKYFIYNMRNPLTGFLFNSSALVAGQDVAIGGPDSGVVSETSVAVNRIHLRNWGFNGTIVKGSENASQGSFQMQVKGFAGVLIPETITVYLGGKCDFRYGMGAFTDLTDGANIRVVGLLLKNPTNGQVILWARHVDGLNFTDFTTAAFE